MITEQNTEFKYFQDIREAVDKKREQQNKWFINPDSKKALEDSIERGKQLSNEREV